MRRYEIEELAQLLALLRPAPTGWVEAAQELPRIRAGLDALIARAEQDAAVRARMLEDLEQALTESNLPPTSRLVEEARRRLAQ
ncbi:MAG TPA: hypothetical protein VGQ38_11720 [Gaiellaceae bacterium]|jgi:hypothetical protein|nr:hypothetical protein [Gaiellaceae bacterium]